MWFHRGWDIAAIDLIEKFDDCGISTFFNYPYNISPHSNSCKIINENAYYSSSTGVAGSLIYRELFNKTDGFFTPPNIKMGYIGAPFCKKTLNSNIKRNKQYGTIPFFSEQMDRNYIPNSTPKLSQDYLYKEYNERRDNEKIKFRKTNK